MPKEVDCQIYCIKLPMPFSAHLLPFSESRINVYLVRRGQSLLLVDCGVNDARSYEALRDGFAQLGFKFSQLTHLVVTHGHPDHAGLLDTLLLEAPQAQVYLHRFEMNLVEERYFRPELALQKYRAWFARQELPPENAPDFTDIKLDYGRFAQMPVIGYNTNNHPIELDGDVWQLIWTPGHSPGHLVVYQPERELLFTGDHLFASFTPNISQFPGSSADPLDSYLTSLITLTRLKVKTAMPGHGPTFTGIDTQISRTLKQHQRKLNRIIEVLSGEPISPFAVVQHLWRNGLAVDSQRAALTETVAYLTWLSRKNYIDSENSNGIIRFFRNPSRPLAGLITLNLENHLVPLLLQENTEVRENPPDRAFVI